MYTKHFSLGHRNIHKHALCDDVINFIGRELENPIIDSTIMGGCDMNTMQQKKKTYSNYVQNLTFYQALNVLISFYHFPVTL